MSIFGVEFIFCCPCFLENIVMAMETKCVKNYHFGCFLHRAIKKYFRFKNFTLIKEQFFTCMIICVRLCIMIWKFVCIITKRHFFVWLLSLILYLEQSVTAVIGELLENYWSIFPDLLSENENWLSEI